MTTIARSEESVLNRLKDKKLAATSSASAGTGSAKRRTPVSFMEMPEEDLKALIDGGA